MDNQNNPNLPNNPLNTNPFRTPPSPASTDASQTPNSVPTQVPASSWPADWSLPSTDPAGPIPAEPTIPLPANPHLASVSGPTPPAWTPPPQAPISPEPAFPAPVSTTPLPSDNTVPSASGWPATQPTSDSLVPTPTYTPPQSAPAESPSSGMSPLDNPWGAPAQPPSIDGSTSPIQPSWMNVSQSSTPESTPSTSPADSIPTDLSHLINNNLQQPSTQAVPESLVVPTAAPEVPSLPTEARKGIPKWLIGVGAGLLILVVAASAYFILGVGQPTKTTTSLPATIATQSNQAQPATPTATPAVQAPAQPVASNSANSGGTASFGQLQGEGNPTATSAADLLRQRQQAR